MCVSARVHSASWPSRWDGLAGVHRQRLATRAINSEAATAPLNTSERMAAKIGARIPIEAREARMMREEPGLREKNREEEEEAKEDTSIIQPLD